jgi:hypothetical protein
MLNNAYNIEITDKLTQYELNQLKIIKDDLTKLYIMIKERQK